MNENNKHERIIYLDILRILSIFAVVVIHVAARNWYTTDVHNIEWLCFNFYDSIARWAVPMFVMISGTIFLDPVRKVAVSDLYKRNIAKIFIIFFLWSSFYIMYQCINAHKIFPFSTLYMNLFKGFYHLWFLPMIAGLYMVVPLVKEMVKTKKMLQYFVGLSLLFTFFIPTIRQVLAAITPIIEDKSFSTLYQPVFVFYDNINFSLTSKYVAYFVLGYWLSCTEIGPKSRRVLYVFSLLSFAFMILFSAYIAQAKNERYGFYSYMSLTVMIEAAAIFVFVKYHDWNILSENCRKIIIFISNRCLGIYLIHAMILDILATKLGFQTLAFNTYISTPVISVVIFCLSLMAASILYKIPKLGKYLG